ncbi:Maf family protein, partial [Rhodoferax sp. OV413]|uniref:Maf family protein n=1 Tax=Rhodoferax sp. OV413 TaxID=1855285 RepID=UPI0025DA983B
MTNDFIYLASQSPRRRELLGQIGVAHELLLPRPDEDAESLEAVMDGEAPAAYVQRVTALKLIAARARLAGAGGLNCPILCADTTVALGHIILGKPQDAEDAKRILSALAGTTH